MQFALVIYAEPGYDKVLSESEHEAAAAEQLGYTKLTLWA
jgi:hypothetical protein